jgi:acyl-CoA reductase-like NAD-dependent aldehyde dehydrogenase
LNRNAWKHGAFADVEKLDARLEGNAREHVDTLAESLLDRAAETVPEMPADRRRALAREAALLMYQQAIAGGDLVSSESGGRGFGWDRERTVESAGGETITYTEPVVNPVVMQITHLSTREYRIWDELELWPTS